MLGHSAKRVSIGICLCIVLTVLLPVGTAEAGHRGLDPTPLVEWFGGRVTSGFRDPARPYHVGIDFGVGWGAPIPSTWEGTVVHAGWYGDFGNMVIVQNGDWQMRYAHLSQFCVSVGQQVETGTVVGLSGNTGVSTGAHLHYEVRYQGTAVDPMTAPGAADGGRPAGDYIELHVHGNPHPELWTVVQWQAVEGDWRDVEGWRGTPDEITGGVGKKTWWVSEEGFGRGPFRWVVYSQSEGDRRLGVSGAFYLPDDGRAVIVAVWVP